jgi:hypothetical protein
VLLPGVSCNDGIVSDFPIMDTDAKPQKMNIQFVSKYFISGLMQTVLFTSNLMSFTHLWKMSI